MSTKDPGALYADTRQRCQAVFRGATEEQAAATVPLTPEWTVTDVAAHVCGINADVVNGRVEGLGTEAWTAHQVDERKGRSIGEICDEWVGYADRIAAMVADQPFLGVRVTGDLIVHLQDVQHALDLEVDRSDAATAVAAARYVPHLQERVRERLGIGISVALIDGEDYPIEGAALGLRATPYDFLRSVTGRRSLRQVESLDWSGDPTALFDQAWNAYGPFREADVSI